MDELKWITQFSQLTASSILAGVLGWLLYHMPRHFAAERLTREKSAVAYAKTIESILNETREQNKYEREMCERHHRENTDAQERRYREWLDISNRRHTEIAEKSEARHVDMVKRMEASHNLLRESVHAMNNVLATEANRRAAEELRTRRNRPRRAGGDDPTDLTRS